MYVHYFWLHLEVSVEVLPFRFLPKILISFLQKFPFLSILCPKNPSRLIKPNYHYKIVLKFETKYSIALRDTK